MKALERWASIALVNLGIVAMLGFIMRSKLMFSMPAVNFKHTLHAHSHFAFGGWVTLALMALMIYQMLPERLYNKPVYRWLLSGILLNAVGMLLSFLYQGYALFSIVFSVIFILVTYIFSFVFIKDIVKANANRSTRLLAICSVVYLVLSSAGPFTLGYLLATKSPNAILYKDAIYTYLHLQYSGFFTLAVFALLINKLVTNNRTTQIFAGLLSFSVVPSMFISYLWHYPALWINIIAMIGSLSLAVCTFWFFLMLPQLRLQATQLKPVARKIAIISMAAFVLKMIFQSLTIIPSLGPLVFANRPVIIGFLHLVLLGFVSLYILAHFIEINLLSLNRTAQFGLWLFVSGILLNEIALMAQGLGFMFMLSSAIMYWLLWIAAICLMAGAMVMAANNLRRLKIPFLNYKTTTKSFSQL
jgi:hypothetical protein